MNQNSGKNSNKYLPIYGKANSRLKHVWLNKKYFYHQYLLDGGFSIQVAVIAFLVVILGSVALASRVTSGLYGASVQSQNREARDAAEAGLLEVINEFNKEPNRMLLLSDAVSGAESLNGCTKFTSDLGATTTTAASLSQRAQDILATRTNSPGYINLTGSSSKQFKVQKIEYKDKDRVNLADSLTTSISDILQSGRDRTLIRVTIVGKATSLSGKSSFSRIAREYEVVPKCCRRSFGFNTSAGLIWGGDNSACLAGLSGGGSSGIVGGLNGGIISMNNSSPNAGNVSAYVVTAPGGSPTLVPVTQGLCYAGTPAGSTYLLAPDSFTAPSTSNCLNNSITAGKLSFVPAEFTFPIPPAGSIPQWLGVNNDSRQYCIDDTTTPSAPVVKFLSSSNRANPCSSGNTAPNCRIDSTSTFVNSDSTTKTLHVAKCFFDYIDGGSNSVYFDTSRGRFDAYFRGSCRKGSNDQYTCFNGGAGLERVQCSSTAPSCTAVVNHLTYASDLKYGNPYIPGTFDNSERLNFYVRPNETNANLIFEISGNGTAGKGINIIAPKAGISILGNGSVIGRLWSDKIRFNGSSTVETIGAPISGCPASGCPSSTTTSYDVVARSHTQATAF